MGRMRTAMMAAALLALAGEAAAQQPQRRPVTEQERQAARAALDAFTRPTLTRFDSEAEFRRYVAAVVQVERTSDDYYYSAAESGLQLAQAAGTVPAPGQPPVIVTDTPPLCPPDAPPPCPRTEDLINSLPQSSGQPVIVTGSRIPAPTNPSITNNQMRGVEEGDIVKQIGHYLLVLQDGRIFVIDIAGAANRRRLRLTDRADVYRDARFDMWYDEMLVSGDRVLVTGYSYEDNATELAVFRLSPAGRLARQGVFRISSNDYYDNNNYATRLIGDDLVVYTPFEVRELADENHKWPVVRRWLPEDDAREVAYQARRARDSRATREELPAAGPPLLDGAQIYRPVQRLDAPVVHTVSVCPLASTEGGRGLACRSTAFVGPEGREWYVTGDHVYLWTARQGSWRNEERCAGQGPVMIAGANPALLYRVPLSGAGPDLVGTRGIPPDQFAMQADARNLYALVRLRPEGCRDSYDAPARLAFATVPLARLGPTLSELPMSAFTPMPATPTQQVASRFTERYLVYGGLSRYRGGLPDPAEYSDYDDDYRQRMLTNTRPMPAWVVPVGQPGLVRPLDVGHTVIRAERVADDIVLTGYRDRSGLSITLIDLDGPPRVASTVRLVGRYESEGRSHAFNSLVEANGSGLMGLPTVRRVADSGRDYWRSRASDLSFLAFRRNGLVTPIGTLERRFDYVDDYDEQTREEDEDGVPGYRCEVSCTDWYGNSRPIFTGGRIFGLSGTELIEGRVAGGRIREVQRLNIALSPVPAR